MTSRRELVMLAHVYRNENPKEFLWSEKFDGVRALWVPQLRGTRPQWAKCPIDATGLFSRYGAVFRAPDWFLDLLPQEGVYDGELIKGTLGGTLSVVRSHHGDWRGIKYHIFDQPAPQALTMPGHVKNLHHEAVFTAADHMGYDKSLLPTELPFLEGENYVTVKQNEIEDLTLHLDEVLSRNGEGIMLRKKRSLWVPKRTRNLLKLKKLEFGEGKVTGHTKGLGKYVGLLGAVEIDNQFLISGFTDYERKNPPAVGTTIKYKFSGRTTEGHPRNARFDRTS